MRLLLTHSPTTAEQTQLITFRIPVAGQLKGRGIRSLRNTEYLLVDGTLRATDTVRSGQTESRLFRLVAQETRNDFDPDRARGP
jgi:hypothetical protein